MPPHRPQTIPATLFVYTNRLLSGPPDKSDSNPPLHLTGIKTRREPPPPALPHPDPAAAAPPPAPMAASSAPPGTFQRPRHIARVQQPARNVRHELVPAAAIGKARVPHTPALAAGETPHARLGHRIAQTWKPLAGESRQILPVIGHVEAFALGVAAPQRPRQRPDRLRREQVRAAPAAAAVLAAVLAAGIEPARADELPAAEHLPPAAGMPPRFAPDRERVVRRQVLPLGEESKFTG